MAAPDPQRECRAAHLPQPAQPFRRRHGGTGSPAGSCSQRGANRPGRICSPEEAEREFVAAQRAGVRLIALGEPEYPDRLQAIYDAPPLVAVRGQIATLLQPMVAMVGSRMRRALE